MKLTAKPPFSLNTVIRSHGWASLAPFGHTDDPVSLTYIDRLDTGRVVELGIFETSDGVHLQTGSELEGEEWDEIARKVRWMLGLGMDFSEFYALARAEPKLAHVQPRAQGRLLRSPTLFEDVVKTILTTNTSWGGTIRMVAALVSEFGEPLESDPTRRAFPTPERLAQADEETLRTRARLGYRSPYILELANALVSGALDLEALKENRIPTDELRKRLLAIKGVGGYAAANLLMLLGRYDHIPVDSWAVKLVSHEWHGGEPVGKAQVEAAFEGWGRWKGLAFWFWDWDYSP